MLIKFSGILKIIVCSKIKCSCYITCMVSQDSKRQTGWAMGIQSVFNGYFHIAIEQVIARQSKLSGMPGLSFCPAPPPLSCLPLSMSNTVPSLYPRSTIPSVLQQLILFPDLLPPFSLFAIGFRSLQLKKRIR